MADTPPDDVDVRIAVETTAAPHVPDQATLALADPIVVTLSEPPVWPALGEQHDADGAVDGLVAEDCEPEEDDVTGEIPDDTAAADATIDTATVTDGTESGS